MHSLLRILLLLTAGVTLHAATTDPLPSWREGPAKQRIIELVSRVTTPGGPDFVAGPERIACFDNDGTLWNEQPMYVQLEFAVQRVQALAPQHPEWNTQALFRAAIDRDLKTLSTKGVAGLLELTGAVEAGLTTDEFTRAVEDWLSTARHPKYHRPYTDLVYQPMLEVLAYLRANGFKTFIVSGGSLEFMRPWAEQLYGVPPEQILGSMLKTTFELRDGKPVITRGPETDYIDDRDGKARGIERVIGRRPLIAFGNSDGDIQMLQWTTSAPGLRLAFYVHHDDTEREDAYDRTALFGKLDKGLAEAAERGWVVISMKNDWKRVFAVEP